MIHSTESIYKSDQRYNRIEERWQRFHFKISIGATIVVLFMEILMFFVMDSMDVLSCTRETYIFKYILMPTGVNTGVVLISYIVCKMSHMKSSVVDFAVSIALALIANNLIFFHGVFSALYVVIIIPILMTTVYGRYLLTTVTMAISLFLEYLTVFFSRWDLDRVVLQDDPEEFSNFLVAVIVILGAYIVCIIIIYFEREKRAVILDQRVERDQLKQELLRDGLTEVFNRLALQDHFDQLIESKSYNYFLAMVDIDNFKTVNDQYGHLVGDEFLKEFGKQLMDERNIFTAFRFGGDEFCLLFRDFKFHEVLSSCRNLKFMMKEKISTHYPKVNEREISISIGVAQAREGLLPKQVLEHADTALYQAKSVKDSISIYKENV